MRVIETNVEPNGPDRIKITTVIDLSLGDDDGRQPAAIGEGPTGSAIPDEIVRVLIAEAPTHSLTADQLKRRLGGNPSTVNRQAWTLAANAPDLQHRLRGWVISPDRGLYALSEAARAVIKKGGRF